MLMIYHSNIRQHTIRWYWIWGSQKQSSVNKDVIHSWSMVKPSEINSRSGRFLQAAGGSVSCAIKFNCDAAAIKTNLAEMITRTRAARVPAVVKEGLEEDYRGIPKKSVPSAKSLCWSERKILQNCLYNPLVVLLIPREPWKFHSSFDLKKSVLFDTECPPQLPTSKINFCRNENTWHHWRDQVSVSGTGKMRTVRTSSLKKNGKWKGWRTKLDCVR